MNRRLINATGIGVFLATLTIGALPAQAGLLVGNFWPNPTLEDGAAGVPVFWNQGGSDPLVDIWATDFAVSPSHALKLDDANASGYGEWYSRTIAIEGDRDYLLRYNLRYETEGGMRVSIRFYDISGSDLPGLTFGFTGTQPDWEELTQPFTAPVGAVGLSITFASGGSQEVTGTAWLDDVSLAKVSAPSKLLADNLWPNPTLETGNAASGIPDFWQKGGGAPATINFWSEDLSVSPSHSLKLDDQSAQAFGEWYSDRLAVEAGATYFLRYSLRTESAGGMRLTANFFNGGGTAVTNLDYIIPASSQEWQELNQTFTAPTNAATLGLSLVSGQPAVTGTVWLDDISLAKKPGGTIVTNLAQPTDAETVGAAFATGITLDGQADDWAGLPGGVITMDTRGLGTNYGTLSVDVRYAWDYTNLYILVQENTNYATALVSQQAPDAAAYQAGPWSFDTVAFWVDLDNNAGSTNQSGQVIVENNADFQPWFGFSSQAREDLTYARVNNTGDKNMAALANAKVATGGTFAQHNRTIEIAIKWADVAASVDKARQPGGDLRKALAPGFTFGSEPLLILKDYNAQAFIGPDPWNPPSGTDRNSRDVRLLAAKTVDAAYSSAITVDGAVADWAELPSGVVPINTQGRGAGYGTLAVNIQYAWDYTNLYLLIKEDRSQFVPLASAEAASGSAYQSAPWTADGVAFWLDLDNNAGFPNGSGGVVTEANADFQPWFGFSSQARTDLFYARANDSGTLNLAGLASARVATGGTFAEGNRRIEVAVAWADLAAAIDVSRQPGGDLLKAITPGFTFGSEPLLVLKDYNGQAFLGPDQWNPPNGVDSNSRDIRLRSGAKVVGASYAGGLGIDGDASDWAQLPSGVVTMDTKGRGTDYGTLAVDIRYAWDYTNLYVLVKENTNATQALVTRAAPSGTAYQAGPWSYDSIAFWIDLDNDAGSLKNGAVRVEVNADYQPWFGFSSAGRTDLMYGRVNNTGDKNMAGLAHAKMATSGTFAQRNRVIEIAMAWGDMTTAVDAARQPGGNLATAIGPGFTFGSEPLLILKDFNGQAFIGPDPWNPSNGVDADSRDIQLLGNTVVPKLSLSPSGNRTFVLKWTGSAAAVLVETTSQLGDSAAWTVVGNPSFVGADGQNWMILPWAGTQAAFYRLRQ